MKENPYFMPGDEVWVFRQRAGLANSYLEKGYVKEAKFEDVMGDTETSYVVNFSGEEAPVEEGFSLAADKETLIVQVSHHFADALSKLSGEKVEIIFT